MSSNLVFRASVITVTFNSADFVAPFCEAVAALRGDRFETIVVDNASRDGTVGIVRGALPGASVVSTPRNLGFAGASNLGARHARGDVLCFLNPDTRPPPGAVEQLCERVWRDQRLGAAGGKLVFPDRRLQSAGARLGPNGFSAHRGWGEVDRGQFDEEAAVDYVPAAALAIRRTLFWEVGGFCDGYFPGFYEDTELCLRLRRRGYTVLYVPTVPIVHLESRSMGRRFDYWFHRNRLLFLARNAGMLDQRPGLVSEARWVSREYARPLLRAITRRQAAAVMAIGRRLGFASAGVLAGAAAVARARCRAR